MDPSNSETFGYWVVEPRNPLWASWTTYKYMIMMDSLGRFVLFMPSRELIASTPKIQPPEAAERQASLKAMQAPKRNVDFTQSSTVGDLYRKANEDPRLEDVEYLPQALEDAGQDFRLQENESAHKASELLPDDGRMAGPEKLEDALKELGDKEEKQAFD